MMKKLQHLESKVDVRERSSSKDSVAPFDIVKDSFILDGRFTVWTH